MKPLSRSAPHCSPSGRNHPPRTRGRHAAFTLLELLVVLAILAIVTALAVRSLDGVQDQRRYEANNQILRDIESAVLGLDEASQASSFVADMGRLPRTMSDSDLTLSELWKSNGNPAFNTRSSPIDADVAIPTGWRGPYLRLPLGATQLVDGWGNPFHLSDESGQAVISGNTRVAVVQHLGSNGETNPADEGFASDGDLDFRERIAASVRASVQVCKVVEDHLVTSIGDGTDKVLVRVFGPDPNDANLVQVLPAAGLADAVALTGSPVTVPSPTAVPNTIVGATVGPRAVRAYLFAADGTLIAKSAVKTITLRPTPVVNTVSLTIIRP